MAHLLNPYQKASLATVLRMFEEDLRQADSWLDGRQADGILYRRQLYLTPPQRSEARPDSNIDFLVNLESGRSLLDLEHLLRELQTLLGHKVDVVTEAGLRPRIRLHVLEEARPL